MNYTQEQVDIMNAEVAREREVKFQHLGLCQESAPMPSSVCWLGMDSSEAAMWEQRAAQTLTVLQEYYQSPCDPALLSVSADEMTWEIESHEALDLVAKSVDFSLSIVNGEKFTRAFEELDKDLVDQAEMQIATGAWAKFVELWVTPDPDSEQPKPAPTILNVSPKSFRAPKILESRSKDDQWFAAMDKAVEQEYRNKGKRILSSRD